MRSKRSKQGLCQIHQGKVEAFDAEHARHVREARREVLVADYDAKRNRQADADFAGPKFKEPRTEGLARAREEHAMPARHALSKEVIRELVKGKHAGFLVRGMRGRNGRGKIVQGFVFYRHN